MRWLPATLWATLWAMLLVLTPTGAWTQVRHGEVRLKISDPTGAGQRATVELINLGSGYDQTLTSDEAGGLTVREVPYGVYALRVRAGGFAPFAGTVTVRSAIATTVEARLSLAAVATQVTVSAGETLVDPESAASSLRIGAREIAGRVGSLPGRSVQDLVASQPGWLDEGSAVLHPRGSEYQTQMVVDGIPLTDNRSPSFGPEIEADDLESVTVSTAGYPAEYGRKLGGVVELETRRQMDPGTHGEVALAGGSYDTASGYGRVQEVRGKNLFGASASGAMTSHYLNPVVAQNFTNTGTTGDFAARYARDFGQSDRLSLSVRHELSRYLIPDELLQERAGQVENGDNFETMGTVSYTHTVSAESVLSLAGMVRDHANDLYSNRNPTPIAAFQNNSYREGYFKGTYTLHRGRQEFKAGVESDATMLHESFHYVITDPTQFDDGTPGSLSFQAQRPDLEQSGFFEDSVRLGGWTANAGLRWDHYQLLRNEEAFSPRIAVGRSVPRLGMVLHGSYDRIFQTPSADNILISGSPEIQALSSQFLRLPVRPSRGNYFEGGMTTSFFGGTRLDVNGYRRNVSQFADDDQLLNTGVSYPISFAKAAIYGAEGKLNVVRLGGLSGYVSYSYMVGMASFPVTGGLFLGDGARAAQTPSGGHFPVSQDQRNTVRTRFLYQVTERAWVASGASYGSGLPFAYGGSEQDALAQYGPEVVGRINFARGRVRPSLAVNASLGMDLHRGERMKMTLQVDGDNLTNRLNVIDFGGLFSGNAIGPGRSLMVRWRSSF